MGIEHHTRNPSSALGQFGADVRGDRPTSVGYVSQHSIRTVNQSDHPEYMAEVVDGNDLRRGGSNGGGGRSF